METTVSDEIISEIDTQLKIALLKLPNLTISDSQAIDNRALQSLLSNEYFQSVVNHKTHKGPSLEIMLRSSDIAYEKVLESWLDIKKHKNKPTYLSGLSEEINKKIKTEHANGTLTLSRFEELAPEYFTHVKNLKQRIKNTDHFELGPSNFVNAIEQTLKDVKRLFPGSDKSTLAEALLKRWKKFSDPTRSDLLIDARIFIKEKNLSQDLSDFIENSIISFSYQRSFSKMTNHNIVAGNESIKWISSNKSIRITSNTKISVKLPDSPFIKNLSWEGLKIIRDRKELIDSMIQLNEDLAGRSSSSSSKAVNLYMSNMLDAYQYVIDLGHAPNPHRWHDVILNIVEYGAPVASSFLENLIGIGNVGNIIGDFIGDTTKAVTHGIIMSQEAHGYDSLRQVVVDLSY